jgi:MFS family permease
MISLVKKAVKARQEREKTQAPSTPMEMQQTQHDVNKEQPQCRHMDAYESPNVKCALCASEKKAARVYRWKIILGLMAPFALQALDSTIIASALPWIAGDFGEISQLNWIVSAFNLTSAAFIPFWSQMADVFGRNASLNAAIILMLIGSALCTGAPTTAFPVLLLGRGFQGLAAAGLNVVVRTILADKVSLQENAKNWAIFSLVGGISYGLGPVIGGRSARY